MIGLSAGSSFLLTFYLGNTGASSCGLNVTFGSTVVLSTSNTAITTWTAYRQVVTAASSTQTLTFSAYNDPSYYDVSNVTIYPFAYPPPPPYAASLSPPVTNGLIGMYTADQWTGRAWLDISGSSNHLTIFSGTVTSTPSGINGRTYISGTVGTSLVWPSAILPQTYTLFHIAKYNNGARSRIFNGYNPGSNWLSGYWGGNNGVAYHNGWLTPTNDCCGYNWVLSTDQNSLYR